MPELFENLLAESEADNAWELLRPNGNEVAYGQYYALTNDHSLVPLPRLMAFQASKNSSGDFPWYRCTMSSVPQNQISYLPWTPTVRKIKDFIEQKTNETWNLAHIIYYKDGDDSMGMHSDTMLDLAPGSKIAVVSFGSCRQLELIKKNESTLDGPSQMKFRLPGNSLFLLDEETNKHYVHGIRKEKRNHVEDRIAIVFRHVTTFKTDYGTFYGQGSASLTKQDVIQRETQRKMFQYLLSFLFAVLITFLLPKFLNNWFKLILSGIFGYFINVFVGKIDQKKSNYTNQINNERLQKLCQMKNFKIWDQNNMRDFLKYS